MKFLLDVHFSPVIARELRSRGHDVDAAAEDADVRRLSDEALLEHAVDQGRALVTNNAKDFLPVAAAWARSGRDHLGLILTSDRSMPRDRSGFGRFVTVLDRVMTERPGSAAFLNQGVWLTELIG